MPARKKPVAKRQASSAPKSETMAHAPTVQPAPASAQTRNTRRGGKRSAIASSANTRVPAMKPACSADVRVPTAVAGQPKARCRSGMTALTANQSEVPANCASTSTGRT
ncbi:hypothetical protein BC358_00795 [Hydrogenophaga sp. H7]|nr:hypothetical protein BC358_00795 [Hydrogenophaga sp. H7]